MSVPLSLLNECLFALLRVLVQPVDQSGLLVAHTGPTHYAIQRLKVVVRREYLSLADLVDAVVKLAFHKFVVFYMGHRFQRDKRFYYSFRWGRVGIYNIKIVFFTGGI